MTLNMLTSPDRAQLGKTPDEMTKSKEYSFGRGIVETVLAVTTAKTHKAVRSRYTASSLQA